MSFLYYLTLKLTKQNTINIIAKAYFKYRAIPVPKLHSRIMTFETTQFEFGMTTWHGSRLAVPHGSSTTWLQTACRYELNS